MNDTLTESFDLSKVRGALAIVDTLRPLLTNLIQDSAIDHLHISGRCRVGIFNFDDLIALQASGHLVRVQIREDSWEAAVIFDGPAVPNMETSGRPEEAFSTDQILQLRLATDQGDIARVFDLATELNATLNITVRNDPTDSGTHWIYRVDDIGLLLGGPNWVAGAMALGKGPRVISVSNPAQIRSFTIGNFLVRGDLGVDGPIPAPAFTESDQSFRSIRALAGRANLPSPLLFSGFDGGTSPHDDVSQVLLPIVSGVIRRLVWHWLSTSSTIRDDGSLELIISGARLLSFELRPEPVDDVGAELALYRWASSGDDPARTDAIEQATSLAITNASDVATAAAPALRTARSVYELARRGAVAEALATRRSARQSALAAAREAANAAREAAGKSIERTLVQMAAVVAVVISSRADVISLAETDTLLALLALLSVIFIVVTRCFSLQSASGGLAAELADLDQYREALAIEDLQAIRAASVIEESRQNLRRASLIVVIVYGALIVAAVGAMIFLTVS